METPIINLSIPLLSDARREKEEIKRQFLECVGALSDDLTTHITTLRQIVQRALDSKISWKELIKWAAQTGHKNKYVRSVLSQILIDSGIRRRRRGAGPETPEAALAMLRDARYEHGDVLAEKLLLAAWRASVAQRLAQRRQADSILKIVNG